MTTLDSLVRGIVLEVLRAELPGALRAALAAHAPSEYLRTSEAAAVARVTMGTVRRWIRVGRLPSSRAGRVLRVRRADLERLMTGSRDLTDAEIDAMASEMDAKHAAKHARRSRR